MAKRATRTDGLAGGGHLSSMRTDRLLWLTAHLDRLVGIPSSAEDMTDNGRAKLLALGEDMVREGLYSKRVPIVDRNWGIRVLIAEARRRVP